MEIKNLNSLKIFLLSITFTLWSNHLNLTSTQSKSLTKEEIKKFNDETLDKFKINKDTIIAFDLHGVIAKYDTKKMLSIFLKNFWGTFIILYPKALPMIYKKIKQGASAQEILDAIVEIYPHSQRIKKIYDLGILISSQLKPMYGTIDIIKRLINKGYKIVIMSNIEPLLWNSFVKDFPMFAKFEKFIADTKNNYLKKPNPEYFKQAIRHFQLTKVNNCFYNVFFVDDNPKFALAAKAAGIYSYIFTNPEDLDQALEKLNA